MEGPETRTLAQIEAEFTATVGKGWVLVQGFDATVDGRACRVTAVMERTVVVTDEAEPTTGRTLVLKTRVRVADEPGLRWVPMAAALTISRRRWNGERRPKSLEECQALRAASDERAMRERERRAS